MMFRYLYNLGQIYENNDGIKAVKNMQSDHCERPFTHEFTSAVTLHETSIVKLEQQKPRGNIPGKDLAVLRRVVLTSLNHSGNHKINDLPLLIPSLRQFYLASDISVRGSDQL